MRETEHYLAPLPVLSTAVAYSADLMCKFTNSAAPLPTVRWGSDVGSDEGSQSYDSGSGDNAHPSLPTTLPASPPPRTSASTAALAAPATPATADRMGSRSAAAQCPALHASAAPRTASKLAAGERSAFDSARANLFGTAPPSGDAATDSGSAHLFERLMRGEEEVKDVYSKVLDREAQLSMHRWELASGQLRERLQEELGKHAGARLDPATQKTLAEVGSGCRAGGLEVM